MDGESVSDPDSPSYASYTDAFLDAFPEYLAMGMTPDEFWHGPSFLVRAYRKAYEMKKRYAEWERWRMGMYIYEAVGKLAPIIRATFGGGSVKAGDYVDRPFPLTDKEAKEQADARQIEAIKKMIAVMESESTRNLLEQQNEAKEASIDGDD